MPCIYLEAIASTNSRGNDLLDVLLATLQRALIVQTVNVVRATSEVIPEQVSLILRIGFLFTADERQQGTCVVLSTDSPLTILANEIIANVAGILNKGIYAPHLDGLLVETGALPHEIRLHPLFLHEDLDAVHFVQRIPQLSKVITTTLLKFIDRETSTV